MQKIKYGVLDKLLRADLSRAEMDFILHISHYQDDTGCVSGIYYRDICEALQISYQTFYDVLRSLQAKEIIKVDKAFYGDWDVTILDNSFQNGITGYVMICSWIRSSRNADRRRNCLHWNFLKLQRTRQMAGNTE